MGDKGEESYSRVIMYSQWTQASVNKFIHMTSVGDLADLAPSMLATICSVHQTRVLLGHTHPYDTLQVIKAFGGNGLG